MDLGAVRLPQYTVITPVGRGFDTTTRPNSTTELPAEKTVTPSAEVVATRGTADKGKSGRGDAPTVKREEYHDADTDTLVFRAIDTETGEVLRQVPAEAMLRLRRAFAEALEGKYPGVGLDRKL